jgi:protein O-GlcNAc transferase
MPGFPRSTARAKAPAASGARPNPLIETLLRQADTARQQGDKDAVTGALSAAADVHAKTPAAIPRSMLYDLSVLLFNAGRLADAETRIRQGLRDQPDDFPLTNLLGVILKNHRRYDEALTVLDAAEKLDPKSLSPVVNRGNIHLVRRDGARAAEAFARAVREQPSNVEYQRLLGTAFRHQGQSEKALRQYDIARQLKPDDARNWIDPAGLLEELGRGKQAVVLIDAALLRLPDSRPLSEAKLALLRRAGLQAEALAYGRSLLARFADQAWVHMQLARCVMHSDRRLANGYLQEAVRLEPNNPDALAELADSLDRTRGPDEGANIAAGYELARRRLALDGDMLPHARIISSILNRACDFSGAEAVGSFENLTCHWAETGYISALHYQMAQVRTDEQRRLLLEAHRIWGRSVDAIAARSPIPRPAVRRGRAKLRIGLMSSDLRNHPVAYFALPLIEGYDRERFEFYCYSWNSGAGDPIQQRIASLCDGFRLAPAINDREAAALIAGDGLDMLIELGGTTYMNKLNVMTWKPAPVQASWLGYPHSAGPETIDYILVDPYNRPVDDALLIEKPLVLPRSWVVLGPLGFNDKIPIAPGMPEQRAGYLTFGTMNNPYKYTREVLETWARVVRSVDGAHFLFVRPECAVPVFQDNVRAIFAANGVPAERVDFVAVRGTHMPHYNKIDIALDAFPQTGGTTTCEALWMGVPTVSLVGPCFYERLSNSNLTNAGLADLCVADRDAYVATAVALAADRSRRSELRHGLRTTIRSTALGRADWFVADFQAAIRQTLDSR